MSAEQFFLGLLLAAIGAGLVGSAASLAAFLGLLVALIGLVLVFTANVRVPPK